MKELNDEIKSLLDKGFTVGEIVNGLWSVVDEIRISYAQGDVYYLKESHDSELKYYETLSSVLYSSYAQVRDLEK